MVAKELFEPDEENLDAYDDLIVSIQAKEHGLNLLIAVCDDMNSREKIIAGYEAELQPEFHPYRVTLARGEPSLRSAVAQLVESEEYLRQGGQAVITVTGAEQLYFLKLGEERSEQEIFFGYLQWTREALREFPFAIVLWVTNQMLLNLTKKAPDFWSWRNGVFRFVSRKKNTVSSKDLEPIRFAFDNSELSNFNDENPYFFPIEDLKKLIQQTEKQKGKKDPSLPTLYSRLGEIYRRRLDQGESQDYKTETDLAIDYFSKAINLQKELGLNRDLASSLSNLALLYDSQKRYGEAESFYKQALSLRQQLLGSEHPSVATILNNLALLYHSQKRYSEAESFYKQALSLRQQLLGSEHPSVATILYNLALLYHSQKRYSEAESFYKQALFLRQQLLGSKHPTVAQSLNNLAALYKAQGRYNEAEPLYQQALALRQQLLGSGHPAVAQSFNNLAVLYKAQGRYNEAEILYQQALDIYEQRLGVNHPDTVTVRKNLTAHRKMLAKLSHDTESDQ